MTTLEPAVSADDSALLGRWTVAHDFAFQNGGAEAVTRWICHDSLPGARLVYLAGDQELADSMSPRGAHPILPRMVDAESFRRWAPLIPMMVRRLAAIPDNLLVSSYAFASALRTEKAKVVYCHSPLRQAWSGATAYGQSGPLLERAATRALGPYFRAMDRRAAVSADRIIATSRAVRDRVRLYYDRDAQIIAPPVDDRTFFHDPHSVRDGYYVWAGRITEPYKRLSIVLEALGNLPQARLLVVGEGRDRRRLEQSAPRNVEFVGWRSRDDLADLYRRARGVVFPSEDDFGLVAAEAVMTGTPVIAYGRGGVLDTVRDGENGVLFAEQTADSLRDALLRFERLEWSPSGISDEARSRFGRAQFSRHIRGVLAEMSG